MAKLKNTQNVSRDISRKVIQSIQTNCKPLVDIYLKDILSTQVDAEGKRFPDKKESTKKQYRRNGWNEDQWLIRTGKATVVKYRNILNGLEARPTDPEDILGYVERSESWFTLNESIRNQIIEQVKKDLK